MKKVTLLLSVLALSLCCALPASAAEEAPSDQLVLDEQVQAEKHSPVPPRLEIHGDYRLLYGEGRFSGKAGPQDFHQRLIMPTQRARLFITGHLNDMWVIKTELEDTRNLHDHSTDHHVYMGRFYLEGENKSVKYNLGRFNYYVFDGNTMDIRVDGVRFRIGHDEALTASLFYGRTVRSDDTRRKEGIVATLTHEEGKWIEKLGYFNLRNCKNAGPDDFDRQEIWSWLNRYTFNNDWYTTLELLHSRGTHDGSGYTDNGTGFVWSLNFRPEVNPAQAGDIDGWIKYYRQPRSSIIAHTMDGDPLFFKRLGFTGWGARVDYVLSPGLVLAAEGFLLHNYHDDHLFSQMTEKIIGTSLTMYF